MRRFIWLLLFLLLAGGVYYFFFRHKEEPAKAPPPPAAVVIQEITVGDVPLEFEYAGRTAGSREVEIRARVSGILENRMYTEGDWVNKGDVLFKIDSAPFKAAVAQSQARLTQAERDWQRAEQLYKEKAISPREYDQAQATYAQSKAETQTGNINLGYTTVVAPISGVTSKEGLSEGSLVTADTSLLTRISQLNPIYVDFAYPDTEALSLRQQVSQGSLTMPKSKKLSAEIRFGTGLVYEQEGSIDFTDSIIDAQTGSVRARAVLPNKDNSVLPGQFVRVIVKGFVKKNSVAVPDKSIMQSPQGAFVYGISPENKATIIPVVLGGMNKGDRLIESGLKTGDRIIVDGMIKVKPDAVVNPMTAEQAAAAANAAAAAPAGGAAPAAPAKKD